MARATGTKKAVSMEEALWKSADKLRGSVEPAEYKHVVLSLIFLKYASDRFDEQLWGAMVDYVTVGVDKRLTVMFRNGTGI